MPETEGGAVAEDVRRRIVRLLSSGALRPGDRLGTEREMAERFDVSRSTLRSALVPLGRAGVLERRTGRGGGTFVRAGLVEREAAERLGLPERLDATGHAAATALLGSVLRPAGEAEAAALRLAPGATVVEVERVRYADGLPLSLDVARFPSALVPDLLAQPLEQSLYALLDAVYGLRPDVTEEQVTVVRANEREARELAVPTGSPLLHVTRVAATAEGTPFELSDDLFRADRVRLVARRTSRGVDRAESRAADGVIEIGLGAG